MEVEMVIAVFIGLLALFFGHWYRNRNSLITNWPAVGMLPSLIRNSGRTLDFITNDILRRCGGTFEFKGPLFSNFNFILTTDPMNVNHILSKNFANYEKGSQLREILEPFGEGVFTADSDPWKIQRKIMQALIGSNKFSLYRDKVVREKLVNGLIPIFENVSTMGNEVDLQEVFDRFDYDTLTQFGFGFDPNSLSVEFPVVPSKEAVSDMEEAMRQRHFLPASFWKVQKWLQIGDGKKLIKAKKTLDDFVYNCISLRIEKLRRNKLGQVEEEEEEEFDLLASFLGNPDPDAFEQHSDKFLRDTAVNLYLAGVKLVLTWFFWLVATNPSVETKILEEIKRNSSICKDKNMVSLSEEELKGFIYLHAVLCETLRLYPPLPVNQKFAIQPDILPSGHRINRGSRILVAPYSMGRMEEIWGKDCLEFKPERWISDKGEIIYVPSYKFIAYGAGPRTCLGKDMSFWQMKTMVIPLLRDYQVEVVQGHCVVPRDSISLHMKHGLKVKVKKRKGIVLFQETQILFT